MNIQRTVKRSQWQEGDRSLIRHMGQGSTFLNNFPPEVLSMSSKYYTSLSAGGAIRQVTERENPLREVSQRLVMLAPLLYFTCVQKGPVSIFVLRYMR